LREHEKPKTQSPNHHVGASCRKPALPYVARVPLPCGAVASVMWRSNFECGAVASRQCGAGASVPRDGRHGHDGASTTWSSGSGPGRPRRRGGGGGPDGPRAGTASLRRTPLRERASPPLRYERGAGRPVAARRGSAPADPDRHLDDRTSGTSAARACGSKPQHRPRAPMPTARPCIDRELLLRRTRRR
jgi:hypothetical protein